MQVQRAGLQYVFAKERSTNIKARKLHLRSIIPGIRVLVPELIVLSNDEFPLLVDVIWVSVDASRLLFVPLVGEGLPTFFILNQNRLGLSRMRLKEPELIPFSRVIRIDYKTHVIRTRLLDDTEWISLLPTLGHETESVILDLGPEPLGV